MAKLSHLLAIALSAAPSLVVAHTMFVGDVPSAGLAAWRDGQDICKDSIPVVGIYDACENDFTFAALHPGKVFRFKDCKNGQDSSNPGKLFVKNEGQDDSELVQISTCQADGRAHECNHFTAGIDWSCPYNI
jgi:hypothetical protein